MKPTKINENLREAKKIYESRGESTRINENRRESTKIYEKQRNR